MKKKNSMIVTFLSVISTLLQMSTTTSKEIDDFSLREAVNTIEINVETSTVTVGMIGDILLHHPLYTYENYDFAFAAVKNELTAIDFLLANQESMPGGVELGLSGYPLFNSPKHIVRDLVNSGVDMLSMANNHTFDMKEDGLRRAINHLGEYDMPYIGAYLSVEDREKDRIVNVGGIRIGVLAYTYSLNGNVVPEGKEYMVSMIEEERLQYEISHLKPLVDVVVVSMHWGNEYALTPTAEQESLARLMAEAGADIIFGHHPHVLQKYDEVGEAKVFYSLGNFYSAQQFDSTAIGGIAKFTLNKSKVGNKEFVEVIEPSFYPTAVRRDESGKFVVLPLQDAWDSVMYDEVWVQSHVGLPSW